MRSGRCRPCEDFRFPLMRQWSVREALVHSRYVAVRLQTWQDSGRRQVDELLARMGLPLKFCKQDFCELPAAVFPHLLHTGRQGERGKPLGP